MTDMKRVCVLGNSHAACLKLAWDEGHHLHSQFSLTFFADRRAGLMGLQPRDGMLVPDSERLRSIIEYTSGGLSEVDLQAYDAVLVVGLQVQAYPHADRSFSAAAVRRWLIDRTPRTGGFDLAKKVRQVSGIPAFVVHQPLETVVAAEVDVDLRIYRNSIQVLNEEFFQKLNVPVFAQPEQTITNGFYTKRTYASNAKKLDIGHDEVSDVPSGDRRHMNALYGAVVLSTFLPQIVGLPAN